MHGDTHTKVNVLLLSLQAKLNRRTLVDLPPITDKESLDKKDVVKDNVDQEALEESNMRLEENHEEMALLHTEGQEKSNVRLEEKDEIIEMQSIKRNAASRRRSRHPSTSSSHIFTVSILFKLDTIYNMIFINHHDTTIKLHIFNR